MIAIIIAAVAFFALALAMGVWARRIWRPVSQAGQLGTVSRQWLELHRAEDK